MKFSALQQRVKRSEQVLAVRLGDTQDNWNVLSKVWRQGWSPLRIVVVGLASGFVVGKMEVPGKVNGARWLQMVGSVSNLFASAQATFATVMAAQAAEAADDAAEQADDAADRMDDVAPSPRPAPAPAAAAPAPPGATAPRPAEAATDVSER